MMKAKRICLLLALIICLCVFAACMSNNGGTTSIPYVTDSSGSTVSETDENGSTPTYPAQNSEQSSYSDSSNESKLQNTNPEVITEEISSVKAEAYTEITEEIGLVDYTVGGMLKITGAGTLNGITAVSVRNISGKDIEYALLSAKSGSSLLYFTVSVLPAGTTAVITEDNSTAFKQGMTFISWSVKNEIFFTDELSLHTDVFNVFVNNGSISIKNISKKDITGKIAIVYKDVENGVFTGNYTYRVTVDGLSSGQTKLLAAEHIATEKSRVVYIEYAE